MWIAVGLGVFTALSYVLIQFNILGVGNLKIDEKPAGIIYVAAGCYLLGGLLILLRNRWLLLFGSFINTMVILFFFNLYQDRPAVMVSPGGLISKVAQILLEAALTGEAVSSSRTGVNRQINDILHLTPDPVHS